MAGDQGGDCGLRIAAVFWHAEAQRGRRGAEERGGGGEKARGERLG